jgi:hypothetical protein
MPLSFSLFSFPPLQVNFIPVAGAAAGEAIEPATEELDALKASLLDGQDTSPVAALVGLTKTVDQVNPVD